MKNIKLILCDLDGTLLTDEKTISARTIETIQKARDQGILFGLATGRSLFAVKHLIEGWKIKDQCDVLMGFNGAQIIDEPKNIDEINNQLQGKYQLEIINYFKDLPVNFCIYDGMILHTPKIDELSLSVAKSNHFTPHEIEDESFFTKAFPKLVIVCQPEVMPQVIERAKTLKSEHYHCFQTAPTLFEFVDPKVSKSAGIKRICEIHHISMDEVCVFGDAQNDHDMLMHCGWGVCMINGSDATKALSDDITDLTNNEDGVADYIEKHFL